MSKYACLPGRVADPDLGVLFGYGFLRVPDEDPDTSENPYSNLSEK